MTVVGTRPELIRLSRVLVRLERSVDHLLVHTGQNWDPTLNDVFFDELDLPKPARNLAVDTSSLGSVLAGVLTGVETAIAELRPDALLVLGDTNSCLAALMARRMRVPVYHMEAGNRCFDANVPEETNRRLVDHVSDFNLVYTEHARRNLLAEGLHPRRIAHTGSPMREVLDHYRPQIAASTVLSRLGLEPGGYFIVSAHREENVDDPARLRSLISCLRAIRDEWRLPVLVSTHPRTRNRLERAAADLDSLAGVTFHRPFGFFDYVHLQMNARCTLSDSGSISEESAILGFPAVVLRESIERPEALDTGTTLMTGLDAGALPEAVACATGQRGTCPTDYQITDTSHRVERFILSTVRRHHDWAGVRRPPATGEARVGR
jgi:UDP-N-acetylglucosamine 2-epimerase (non-hydrolysing)